VEGKHDFLVQVLGDGIELGALELLAELVIASFLLFIGQRRVAEGAGVGSTPRRPSGSHRVGAGRGFGGRAGGPGSLPAGSDPRGADPIHREPKADRNQRKS
jgi:hypothetical protein